MKLKMTKNSKKYVYVGILLSTFTLSLAGLTTFKPLGVLNIPTTNRVEARVYQEISKLSMCSNKIETNAIKKAVESVTPLPWSQASSWIGGIPTLGDDVIIPANAKIILDQNIDVKSIEVNGMLNVDISKDISIRTEYVMVSGMDALFQWGTEQNPYLKKGKITLVGNDPIKLKDETNDLYKAIMVMNKGKLELHGKPKQSWVKLDKTANATETKITVSELVPTWEIGDSIVITSTDYNGDNAEIRMITEITGKVIKLNKKLDKKHFGEILSFNQSTQTFDQRAEVGLLSRNIKITGEITAATPNGLGGHIMIMPTAIAHVENVELANLGREGVKGKYPFHWHLCGNVNGQYIKNSTIRNSFNRLVVVHGTNYALIEGIVGFDHIGHGFFLEDGDEEFNTFKNNLGLGTKQAKADLEVGAADATRASTYWITNPNNTFIGNVAAGGEGAGFWIIPLKRLLRSGVVLSKGGVPRDYPLLKFQDNISHSNSNMNLSIDGDLKTSLELIDLQANYPLLDINGDTLTYTLDNFTNYKGGVRGVWTRAGLVHKFINCKFGDSPFMAFISFNGYIENSIFVASSTNTGEGKDYTRPEILGLQMYNGSCDVVKVHMAGFVDATKVCIGNRQSSGKYPNFTASGISFEDDGTQNNKVNLGYFSKVEDPSRSFAFVAGMIDLDGSISGFPGVRIAPKIKNFKTDDSYYADKIYDTTFNLPKQKNRIQVLPSLWNAVGSRNTEFGMLMNFYSWGSDENLKPISAIYGIRSDGPVVYDELRKSWDSQWPVILNEDYIYYTQFHQTPNRISSEFKWTKLKDGFTIAAYQNVPSKTTVNLPFVAIDLNQLKNSLDPGYFLKDNTLYIKYIATVSDERTNTSTKYNDYSMGDVLINFNPDNAPSVDSRVDYVTLADFEKGIDARTTLAKTGDMVISSITNGTGTNKFTINKGTTATSDFVDYKISLTSKQVWREFNKLTITYKGAPAEIIIQDSTAGFQTIGKIVPANTSTSTMYEFDLSKLPITKTDDVVDIRLRFRENDITASTEIELSEIRLSMAFAPGTITFLEEEESSTNLNNQVRIYPNPSLDGIFNLSQTADWKVYSLTGKELKTGNSNQIKLLEFPKGVYLIKLNEKIERIVLQ